MFEARRETGTNSDGEGVELRIPGLTESTIHNLREPFLVEAFGNVGNCATPTGVVAGLARDDVGENTSTASHGGAGVVQRCLD